MILESPARSRTHVPHMVLVDVRSTNVMNPQRRKRPTLMAEFAGKNSKGKPMWYRFVDENGQLFAPRLPKEFDINTATGLQNIKAMKAYILFYDPSIIIIDPQEQAKNEVISDDQLLDAMLRLKQLRQADDEEGLTNLLRRIEGPVGTKTFDQVIAALLRIAKTNPSAILTIDTDPKYAQKVLVDKALEAKRLVQRDRFFYYPDNVFGGRLIAEGEDKLLLEMANNAELSIYINQSASNLSDILSNEPAQLTPALSDEQIKAIREFEDAGTAQSMVETGEEGGQNVSELEAMGEAAIKEVVEKAISTSYLTAMPGGKVKLPDGNTRTKAEAHAFFIANPRAAEALRDEMTLQGLL